MLNRTFGCVRLVWNRTLAWRHHRYHGEQVKTGFTQANAYLTAMKATADLAWLNEVSSVPLQQAIRHQQVAYTNFFAQRARYPRFKSRTGRQSAEYTRSGFRYRDGALFLAKMGTPLAFTWSWPGIDPAAIDPTTVTVSRDPCGRWYVSFAVEVADPDSFPPRARSPAWTWASRTSRSPPAGRRSRTRASWPAGNRPWPATSAGWPAASTAPRTAPRPRRRSPARTGRSARPAPISCTAPRPGLVRDHDVIVIEDLAVQNMVRNRSLAKAISDCGWGTFRQMIEYKTARAGRHLIVTGRWYPSSKTCSACGHLLAELSLNDEALDVPVLPHPARPGHQRGQEHPGGRSCRSRRQPRRCLRS